jgi:hypothetical protein
LSVLHATQHLRLALGPVDHRPVLDAAHLAWAISGALVEEPEHLIVQGVDLVAQGEKLVVHGL